MATSKPLSKTAVKKQAKALLELHLQHELVAFDEAAFLAWFESVSPQLFDWFGQVRVDELVTAAQIKAVIKRNVVEYEIPGAIAEMAGEASAAVFTSDFHQSTRLQDLMSGAQYEEVVDKFLELKEQRRNTLNRIIDLPVYQELISGVMYKGMVRYIYETNVITKNVPGVSSIMKFGKQVMHKAIPKLEDALEDNIRAYIASNLNFLLKESKTFLEESLTDEELKTSALELWDLLETKTLGELQVGMSSVDLSEFVVLGYEFWLKFRKAPYFQHAYEMIVDYLFEKFGDDTVAAVFEELLITPERLSVEAKAFAPSLLASLKDSGTLEKILRARLESFYFSEAALGCLGGENGG